MDETYNTRASEGQLLRNKSRFIVIPEFMIREKNKRKRKEGNQRQEKKHKIMENKGKSAVPTSSRYSNNRRPCLQKNMNNKRIIKPKRYNKRQKITTKKYIDINPHPHQHPFTSNTEFDS